MFLERFSVNKKELSKEAPNFSFLSEAEMDAFSDNIIEALEGVIDQTYGDILILGSVCKVLCRTSPSITEPIKNKSLFNQLIKKASRLYENYSKNYTFNLNRAKEFLNESPSAISTSILKSFILLGKAEDKSVVCKAILQVSRSKISVVCEDSTEDSINVLTFVTMHEADPILNCTYDALVWILLTKEGFYLDSDGYFNRFTPPSTYNLTPKSFYNHTIFDPYHTLEIFTDKQ